MITPTPASAFPHQVSTDSIVVVYSSLVVTCVGGVGGRYMGGCVSRCVVRFLKDFSGLPLNATYIEAT